MTNSEKLRALADWFDGYDFSSKGFLNHNEVQQDLRAMADEFEQLNKPDVMHSLALDKLSQAKSKCISNKHGNESGLLWESLWKYENGKFMSKTCASGVFVDWHVWETEDDALRHMIDELHIINDR